MGGPAELLRPPVTAAVVAGGAVAGCLGSLLGIGGGVFLVPLLNAGLGLEFRVAAATGLMTVIATSSAGSAGTAGRNIINLRLCMVLEVGSAAGGFLSGHTLWRPSGHTPSLVFALVSPAVASLQAGKIRRA